MLRRALLKSSAAVLASASLPFGRLSASECRTDELQRLQAGIRLIDCFGSNSLMVETAAGVLLIDGAPEEHAPDLVATVDRLSEGSPVSLLYNTHWHPPQTGANQAFRERGTDVVAHENTRLWLSTELRSEWRDRHFPRRPSQALPSSTFFESDSRTLGDETINSALLFQAHTDGDIYVHLPRSGILAVGDLMADGVFPVVDPDTGGWIGGLVDAQARLLELADEQTAIIPAFGNVQSREQLVSQHAMLTEMQSRMHDFVRQGKSAREMLDEGIADGFEEWGDPTRFVLNAYPGLWQHWTEIDGVV